MDKFRQYFIYSGIVLLIGIFWACTSNPFFKDNYFELEKISGRVILNDGTVPDSVFVWLDGLDLQTYTDRDGKFVLLIPPPDMQRDQNGLNGTYPLYFYNANYAVDSLPVVLTEGHLEKSQTYIDNDGRLRSPLTLAKLLDFSTTVTPAVIANDFKDTLQVDVRLFSYCEALQVNCFIWNKPVGATTITYQSGVILRPLNIPDAEPVFIYNAYILQYTYYLPYKQETIWAIRFYFDASSLPPGEYEALQFCWVVQENVPGKLMQNFGYNWYWLNADYLKIPMKRNCAVLKILP